MTTHTIPLLTFLAVGLAAAASPLPAQKVPVPEGGGRIVQLVDIQALRQGIRDEDDFGPAGMAPEAVAAAKEAAAAMPPAPEDLRRLTAFLREFAEPPFGPGDDLQPLGHRWLAVLADPRTAGWVETAVARAVAQKDRVIEVDAKILQMTQAAFAADLAPLFGRPVPAVRAARAPAAAAEPPPAPVPARAGGEEDAIIAAAPAAPVARAPAEEPWTKIAALAAIDAALTAASRKPDTSVLSAPRIATAPLQPARLEIGDHTSYIKDFDVEVAQGAAIANPVLDTILDGIALEVTCALVADGAIQVRSDLRVQKVERPIRSIETTLGTGKPVSIQLPQARGVRARQSCVVPAGSGVLVAAQKDDGGWIVAVLQARVLPAAR